jgi:hypothetical protein
MGELVLVQSSYGTAGSLAYEQPWDGKFDPTVNFSLLE